MKTYPLVLCLELLTFGSFAHDQLVHQAITINVAASALSGSPACAGFVDLVSVDIPKEDATNFLVQGSVREDDVHSQDPIGGARSLNHFYDPLSELGLSNIPPDDRKSPYGTNSFRWASTLNCPGIDAPLLDFLGIECLRGNVNTQNKWSWKNARDYEWHGLTEAHATDRHDALTNMFRAVGQVMHLLQDASQPQHTRNEQHLWPGSPIENYGGQQVANLSIAVFQIFKEQNP